MISNNFIIWNIWSIFFSINSELKKIYSVNWCKGVTDFFLLIINNQLSQIGVCLFPFENRAEYGDDDRYRHTQDCQSWSPRFMIPFPTDTIWLRVRDCSITAPYSDHVTSVRPADHSAVSTHPLPIHSITTLWFNLFDNNSNLICLSLVADTVSASLSFFASCESYSFKDLFLDWVLTKY